MEVTSLVIVREAADSDAARALLAAAEVELMVRYPEDGFGPPDLTVARSVFLIAQWDGVPVGCGAIRPFDEPDTAEIKRMFVDARVRGKGIGRGLVRALQDTAREMDYGVVVLETGSRQPEAIGLYESEGFTRRACWGEYITHPLSRCYEKKLR